MNVIALKLDKIQGEAGVKGVEIAQLLGTTPETVSRWRNGKSQPQTQPLDRLLKLDWLASELKELYSPQEARLWLFSHHKMLDGARPVDLIESGHMKEVMRIIDQLKSGAFL